MPETDNGLSACKIPGNPDIAGIGVRAAVYLQALLAVLTFGFLLRTYVTEGPLVFERYIQAKAIANAQDPELEASLSSAGDETETETPDPPQSGLQAVTQPETETASLVNLPQRAEQAADDDSEVGQLLDEEDRVSLRRSRTEINRRRRKLELDALMRFTNGGKRVDEDQACLDMSRSLGRSVILIGAAVLVSALLQAKTRDDGLSHYHTLIILNISWLNCWCAILVGVISKYLSIKNIILNMYQQSARDGELVKDETYWFSRIPFLAVWVLDEAALLIHVYFMCALGLWFWAKPNDPVFTKYIHDTETNPKPCQVSTYYWIFKQIRQDNHKLRIGSLVAYSLFAFLHLPMIYSQLIGLYVPLHAVSFTFLPVTLTLGLLTSAEMLLSIVSSLVTRGKRRRIGPLESRLRRLVDFLAQFKGVTVSRKKEEETREARYTLYSFIGKLAIPLFLVGVAPFVWFVVATEEIISANSVNVLEGELDWTYGQTLALFSAIVAAFSFAGSLWGVIKERRRIQKEQELLDLDKEKAEPSES